MFRTMTAAALALLVFGLNGLAGPPRGGTTRPLIRPAVRPIYRPTVNNKTGPGGNLKVQISVTFRGGAKLNVTAQGTAAALTGTGTIGNASYVVKVTAGTVTQGNIVILAGTITAGNY